MKGFDNLHIKSATKSHNKFDLSRTHLTTMNFGEIVPLFAEELVPGDKFSVKGDYFSRMAPLVVPTYGKFQFKTMASFVPYYQVADNVEAWLAGNKTFEGNHTAGRYFTYESLVQYLADSEITTSVNSAKTYDFTYVNGSGTRYYLALTEKGKYQVKILNALGYALPEGVDFQTGSTWYKEIRQTPLNALPLICFCKAFNDTMSQAQRFNTSELTKLLRAIKHNTTYSVGGYTGFTNNYLSRYGIRFMLDPIKPCYENDYFISAWRSPNAPLGSSSEFVETLEVPKTAGAVASGDPVNDFILNSEKGARLIANGPSTLGGAALYQRSLDFLKSFDDWVRRNNYSGSRAVQQIYSRFGIKTDDYRSNYTNVIATDAQPIQVGDITSQAATSDAALGEYAGKGIMAAEKGFSFDSNDYGMLFVFGWISVSPMNAYGMSKTALKTSPLDFYNAEFDGLGAQAISYAELFSNPINTASEFPDNSVFGFTERYNEYRFGRDQITGEFRDFHSGATMNAWHMGRILTDARDDGVMLAQSPTMNQLDPLSDEYQRIFSVTNTKENKFYLTAHFNVSAVRPMLSLNQVPRLGEGDTNVPRNGNVIN